MHARSCLPALIAGAALILAACAAEPDSGSPQIPTPQHQPDRDHDADDPPEADSTPDQAPQSPPGTTTPQSPEVIATGLDVPWALDFLPDGGALVTLRDRAEVLRVEPGGRTSTVGTIEDVTPDDEGGLLGLAISPEFDQDATVYLYFTTAEDNRIQAFTLEDGSLHSGAVILDGIPRAPFHNGGRIAFGPDGHLYAGTGDAGDTELSQQVASLGGKILRIEPDGDIPPDNPDPGSPVWSWGHRNVQGIAWDNQEHMVASEFGQDTWDELNLIEPGENYGWPVVEGEGGGADYRDPLVQWTPAQASPSGIAFADGAVWMAGLRGQSLWQIPL
ncbi:MAG TPA: PQQ-dependent sugar dehydrogenase, partial [Beutenbergiaceae bacterium]|nr:PQQ-dependent sugar dehydrogenase [Beutenbergiaceae bacterium]